MEAFISIIIFTLPGLMAYFWIQLFGLTPTSKHQDSEIATLSALLWIPIVLIVLTVYQGLALLSNWQVIHPNFDIPFVKKNWLLIDKISDLTILSDSITFLIFYVLLSIVTSFCLAILITNSGYKVIMNIVNNVRERNGLARLSKKSTVWDEMFMNNKGQIVEYSKIDNLDNTLVGSLVKVPTGYEPKNIVLDATDYWGKVMEYYEVKIDNVYIDTESGTILKIYNLDQALEAQDLYNQRLQKDSIS